MASNGKITVVNIKDKELENLILNTKHPFQDSNICKFTIKIQNFTPELGETGKPITYYFSSGVENDITRIKW
jgi:hypothetical protein